MRCFTFGTQIGSIVGNLFQQSLHNGVQASRTNILGAFIDLKGDLGNPPHAIFGKADIDTFGGH